MPFNLSFFTPCSTPFLSEDGLFDMIRASSRAKPKQESKKSVDDADAPISKKSMQKTELKSMIQLTKWFYNSTSKLKIGLYYVA